MTETTTPKKGPTSLVSFLLDFGPLLAFFAAFQIGKMGGGSVHGAIVGTITFMIAISTAIAISRIFFRIVTPIQWISAVLILGFGGLTVYLHDPFYIQIKPTVIYSGFAALLLGGWMRGSALLEYVFAAAFKGLTHEGWLKLSRNWGLFFVGMAIANEAMRATLSFDMWLTIKTWGLTVVSLLFGFAQIPMLLKHGLVLEDAKDAAAPPVGE